MYTNKKKIIIWSKFELNFNNDRIDVTIATIAKFSSFNPSSFVNTFIFILLFSFFFENDHNLKINPRHSSSI